MSQNLKETEKTMGSIVDLLYEANKPMEGLATKFGKFTAESKGMEVIMRLASGTGLWRALNKVKAVGISINEWNENINKANEAQKDAVLNLASQIDSYEKLLNLQKDQDSIVNSSLYAGYEKMYGSAHARLLVERQISDAVDLQRTKMDRIQKMATDEDLLESVKGKLLDFEEGPLSRLNELKRRGLGKVQPLGLGSGYVFEEFQGIEKILKVRWAKFVNAGTSVMNLIKGLSKMIKIYFMGAVAVIGKILLWGAVVFLAIALLKPIIIRLWESFKKNIPALKENIQRYWEQIKPAWLEVWESVKNLWNIFMDPKSSFLDTLVALMGLLWDLSKALLSTLFAFGLPLLFDVAGMLFTTLSDFLATAIDNALVEIGLMKDSIIHTITGGGVKDAVTEGFNEFMSRPGEPRQPMQHGLFYEQSLGAMAEGGFVARSGRYLVGERGPELVNLRSGSTVTPNHKIGNTINVHVNGRLGASDTELRQIAQKVGSMVSREINRTTSSGVRL